MLGRGPFRLSHLLAIGLLAAGFAGAGFFARPSAALAAEDMPSGAAHVVAFDVGGEVSETTTEAPTVAAFLRERGIIVGEHDYVFPAPDVPLSDHVKVTYDAAVPVTIVAARSRLHVMSAATDVGALLEEQRIRLRDTDIVTPSLADPVPSDGIVRIVHVKTWARIVRRAIAPQIVERLDYALTPGATRVVTPGRAGEREVMIRFTQHDDGAAKTSIILSRVVRAPHARVVAYGMGEYEAFERFAQLGIDRTAYLTASAMRMVATAYTASCAGCTGRTATGRIAIHGVVAVDPRVIPLGTQLYIPGYGAAIASDTGGAIHGNRIDLCFNSEHDALQFGRREVTVYRIR